LTGDNFLQVISNNDKHKHHNQLGNCGEERNHGEEKVLTDGRRKVDLNFEKEF
jgi:hypothetical protein